MEVGPDTVTSVGADSRSVSNPVHWAATQSPTPKTSPTAVAVTMAMSSEYSHQCSAALIFRETRECGFEFCQHAKQTPRFVMHHSKQRAFRYAELDALLLPALHDVKMKNRLRESYQHIFHKNHTPK